MRDKHTGGYQYHSRHNSRWERPEREIGPIRAVLLLLVVVALVVFAVAAAPP